MYEENTHTYGSLFAGPADVRNIPRGNSVHLAPLRYEFHRDINVVPLLLGAWCGSLRARPKRQGAQLEPHESLCGGRYQLLARQLLHNRGEKDMSKTDRYMGTRQGGVERQGELTLKGTHTFSLSFWFCAI